MSPVQEAIKETEDARHDPQLDYPEGLPKAVRAMMEEAIGSPIPDAVAMPHWGQQREIFGQWLERYGPLLEERKRNDLNRLLEYLLGLQADEGYREESSSERAPGHPPHDPDEGCRCDVKKDERSQYFGEVACAS